MENNIYQWLGDGVRYLAVENFGGGWILACMKSIGVLILGRAVIPWATVFTLVTIMLLLI